MKRIKAVIFDLDNTLYDERSFVESGFKAVSLYAERHLGTSRDIFFSCLTDVFKANGRGSVFDNILQRLNLYSKENVNALVDIYRKHKPDLRLYMDVGDTLKTLRDKQLLLGLITDGIKSVQQNKVESLGIKELFDCIIYTDELEGLHQKPSVYPYKKMLETLKVSPEESFCVGDNPYKDFVGAKKIGIITVRLLKGEFKDVMLSKDSEAHFNICEIKELLKILDDKTWRDKDSS